MKLSKLSVKNYRSLCGECIEFSNLNLFIGANASGKSTILDALNFLHEGIRLREFKTPVSRRGGMIHLAWKGGHASKIKLVVTLEDEDRSYEWLVRLVKADSYGFNVEEEVSMMRPRHEPIRLLQSKNGSGWWLSGEEDGAKLKLKQDTMACALTAASANLSFQARDVVEFIDRWGFFDPNPFLLRNDWKSLELGRFDPYGRNLGETLYTLRQSSPKAFENVVAATQAIIGLPEQIEPRESESEGHFYFLQNEPGLCHQIHQMGVSSGTLRMLALMTAIFTDSEANLIGMEEPENYVHPMALSAFVEFLLSMRERVQFLVTTHSPLLLDYLDKPEAVRVVQRDGKKGTVVRPQHNLDGVRKALDASGFGLGEFYETKGFGAG